MTTLRITLTIDDPEIDLEKYDPAGEGMTIQEAVEYDAELYESGDISLEEFIHAYGGAIAVAQVEVDDDEEVGDGSNEG